jgi:hypothetical protein
MIIEKIKKNVRNIINIKKFLKKNLTYWKNKKLLINSDKKIMVEIFENNIYEIEQNISIAKIIQKVKKLEIVLFNNGHIPGTSLRNLIYSFFISRSYFIEKTDNLYMHILRNFIKYIKNLKKSKEIYNKIKIKSDIETMEYKDILIGDLIYDEYIRWNKYVYTITKDRKLQKYIRKALLLIDCYEKIFTNNTIQYLVLVDKCYLNHGLLYRSALKYKIKIFTYRTISKEITEKNWNKHPYCPNKTMQEIKQEIKNINYQKKVKEYLEKRFAANVLGLDIAPAYANKKIYTRDELIKLLKLDNRKKNAVIMCHAFSDFPHIDKGLYCDYYVWLNELLELIRDNKKVNWLIKPHPTSYFYDEEGEVEKIIEHKKICNVKIIPKNFSTESIKNIADVLLSVRGTAGLEFGTFGIPIINAGKGSYSGYNICYEPINIDEYQELLKKIETIPKLNDEQIDKMKILLYYIMIYSNLGFGYLFENREKFSENKYYLLNNIIEQRELISFEKNDFYLEILTKL